MTKKVEIIAQRGAPIKYDESYCDKIADIPEQKITVANICCHLGIGLETYYRWRAKYPAFKAATEAARLKKMAYLDDVAMAGALGQIKGFNYKSFEFVARNQAPDYFAVDIGTNGNTSRTEINIGSINSIAQMSTDDIKKKIDNLLKKEAPILGHYSKDTTNDKGK